MMAAPAKAAPNPFANGEGDCARHIAATPMQQAMTVNSARLRTVPRWGSNTNPVNAVPTMPPNVFEASTAPAP
ncbi:hypothetical protein G6F57_023229 [Rhizopus arrhizus]|nr:hypothetical protein G6F57_023229 [Rhizopus arrhizus]